MSYFLHQSTSLQRHVLACVLGLCVASLDGAAQTPRIYRCGNAYTNQPEAGRDCKPMATGHVTVIEGTRVQASATPANMASSGAASKVDVSEQRQRDVQAQAVLQAELQRAQQQQAELLREWHNGEPERRADELRQPEKYQRRVAELRGALQRSEADIAGLQREISRISVSQHVEHKP